jgi:hypothetical protein
MCYPGLDPTLMCETTAPGQLAAEVDRPVEEATSA